MNLQTLPGLFISHGSPMLAISPEQVGPALNRLGLNLPKPEAIIVMSAHWESNALEVSTATRPMTWHDFRGFPEELYEIRYPAPGKPELAEEILKLLADAQIPAHANGCEERHCCAERAGILRPTGRAAGRRRPATERHHHRQDSPAKR